MGIGAKIRIKVGMIELDYEGDPSFLKDGLENLLDTMGKLSTHVPSEIQTVSSKVDIVAPPSSLNSFDFSTTTIAAHLAAKTGPELTVCALGKIELVDGKKDAKRAEILKEMQSATGYYSATMSKNLTPTLNGLIKSKRFHLGAKDTYSLSSTERKLIEGKIANIA